VAPAPPKLSSLLGPTFGAEVRMEEAEVVPGRIFLSLLSLSPWFPATGPSQLPGMGTGAGGGRGAPLEIATLGKCLRAAACIWWH
jgi:hypothetical protein